MTTISQYIECLGKLETKLYYVNHIAKTEENPIFNTKDFWTYIINKVKSSGIPIVTFDSDSVFTISGDDSVKNFKCLVKSTSLEIWDDITAKASNLTPY